MAFKQNKHIFRGMNQDLSDDKQSSDYYIDAHNIRLTVREDTTLLSITNEKGNKQLSITPENGDTYNNFIVGQYVGHAVLNDYLVLFTINSNDSVNKDIIQRINLKALTNKVLYRGNLGFKSTYPLETLVDYETDNIQKVYWTDGERQPRVINITKTYQYEGGVGSIDTQFDFSQNLSLQESVDITRNIDAGLYTSGTIQYVLTYTNNLGIETKPFYVSSLHYISFDNRGAAPNTTVSNTFTINITNIETKFKYLNIYSIQRTSTDTSPLTKLVISIEITNSNTNIVYTDTGTVGENVEPASLFYLGSEKISAYTMLAKDNTLFLGNITLNSIPYNEELKNLCKETSGNIEWINDIENKKIFLGDAEQSYYDYKVQLSQNSNQIKTFKQMETYRLGLQFQENNGNWSEPYFIGDKRNVATITYENNYAILTSAKLELSNEIKNKAISLGYVKARPVMAKASISDRSILCQGIICPTVYNVRDRAENAPFAQSSWFIRPDVCDVVGCYYYTFVADYSASEIPFDFKFGQTLTASKNNEGNITTYYFKVRYAPCNKQGDVTKLVGSNYFLILYLEKINDSGGDHINPPQQDFSTIFPGGVSFKFNGNLILRSVTPYNPVRWTFTESFYRNEIWNYVINNSEDTQLKYGTYNEFRHNYQLPSQKNINAEIQGAEDTITFNTDIFINSDKCYVKNAKKIEWINRNNSQFFVDKSIITFHSPEVELDTSLFTLDPSPYKLRIVGFVPITGYVSDIDLQVNNGPDTFSNMYIQDNTYYYNGATTISATGFYKTKLGVKNPEINSFTVVGGLHRSNFPNWIDAYSEYIGDHTTTETTTTYKPTFLKAAFTVYPWHRTGPLNNTGNSYPYSTSFLKKKQISNLVFSNKTIYMKDCFVPLDCIPPVLYDGGIASPMVTLNSPENSNLPRLIYYGEYQSLIEHPQRYSIIMSGVGPGTIDGDIQAYQDETLVGSWRDDRVSYFYGPKYTLSTIYSNHSVASESINIAYKSSPHYVTAFNCDIKLGARLQNILPRLYAYNPTVNPKTDSLTPFWYNTQDYSYKIRQDLIITGSEASMSWIETGDPTISSYDKYTVPINTEGLESNSILYLGELYQEKDPSTMFGGTSDAAIKNNTWIPAGEPISITTENSTVKWTEGDTYFQRFDCLKTFSYSNSNINNIVEIMSFMCETRINIDGRYDRNRGLDNNLNITNENFNLINSGYTQDNDFFSYSVLGEQFSTKKFKNQITWTKNKLAGAIKDNWTNVILANTLDLDGDKGEITSLNKYKNDIIAFQSEGISQIIYNPSVQINTTLGIPIELANSGKVEGKRYLYNGIGCQNKWSICDETNDIYFIDNRTENIYQLGDKGLISLTDIHGLKHWLNSQINYSTSRIGNFKTFYDKTNRDVYFINESQCLVYSDLLNQFISFMDYNATNAMFNSGNNFYALYQGNIYKQFDGDYNVIYGNYRPYSITFVENQHPQLDKIFTNIEYRSDTYNKNNKLQSFKTFDTVRVFNEYQDTGEVSINRVINTPSALQKKFRIWRIQIPRDKENGIDRIRNTWSKLTLKTNNDDNIKNTDKLVLHDIITGYYF